MRASVTANRDYAIAKIDDRLYGAFLEHLGRDDLYRHLRARSQERADFRTECARTSSTSSGNVFEGPGRALYPGGNFVAAYNGEDGVGPRKDRPTRLDLAWHTSESNQVGVHEVRAMVSSNPRERR